MAKGKGLSPLDALLLLIADLVLIGAMVTAIVASAWLPLILIVLASLAVSWYIERNLSPEQKEQGIRFWRK